jgi:NAD(P)-dependent dehydrogenase (short-subunit alcohol dehydrogenase family)
LLTSHTVLNVADRTAVDSWISATVEQHGRLDGAVNLAAVIGPTIGISNIEDLPDSEWDFIMDVNLKGVFNCMRAQLKAMKSLIAEGEGKEGKQKGGSIVNGASIGGIMGLQHNSAYVASKHAVVGLTRAAAKECGSGGVRVNAIAP